MGDNLNTLLENNVSLLSQDLIDEFNSTYDPKTNSFNEKKVNEFFKKHKDELETLKGFDSSWDPDKPLKEKLAGANFEQTNENYINGLAEKYGATPEEVKQALGQLKSEADVDKEKQAKADEYKREAELRFARQKAVDDYQHPYFGMSTDNPINKGLNKLADFVISNDTKKAVIEDPNNTGRIVGNAAADIAGTSMDFAPGIGGYVIGPSIRTVRNIAEDKDAAEVLKNAAYDYGGNIVLGQGLKGIPGLGDMGALRKIEDKTIGKWQKLAENAEKDVDFDKVFTVPQGSKIELAQWAKTLPPSTRGEVLDIIEHSSNENVQKNLWDYVKKNGEEIERISENMPIWQSEVAAHPIEVKIGKAAPQVTVGVERTGAHKGTLSDTDYKKTNPKKITDYDKALEYIIENTKDQWEAGFKPNPIEGDITYEAYKKWFNEQ